MPTITIQIGNTDDKLTQDEWASYVRSINSLLACSDATIHFFGAPANWERWQNAAWIFVIPHTEKTFFMGEISNIGKSFHQDSIAWTEGETEFI